MGFFGRLTNLSRGWVTNLGKNTDTAVVDTELDHDRLNPKPGLEAEAQLADLKRESVATAPAGPGGAPEASEDPEDTASPPPKKTL
jgi:hypothetical protein